MKKVAKVFCWIGGGVAVFFFLALAGFFVWNRVDEMRIGKEVERAIAARAAEEIEVGETPQETFSLFLDALRDDNFDLAVKYFAPELRDGWRAHLQTIYDKKFLDDMISDLENTQEDSPLADNHFRETDGQWHLVSL